MTPRQRIIYAVVMAVAIFVTAEVLNVGTLLANVIFGAAMGVFAFLAVTVAARITGRGKK